MRNAIAAMMISIATSQSSALATDHTQSLIPIGAGSALVLGRGATSTTFSARGDCLEWPDNSQTQQTGQLVTAESDMVSTREKLDRFLDISASMKISTLGGRGGSAAASMSRTLNVSNYVTNYVSRVTVLNDGIFIRSPLIKQSVLRELENYRDRTWAFLDLCGDVFVSKIVTGGELVASITVETNTSAETTAAQTALTGSHSILSIDAKFAQTVKSLQERNRVRIQMFRSGGIGIELFENVEALAKRASAFPSEVAAAPWRLAAVVQSYRAVANLPPDIRNALDSAENSLGQLISRLNTTDDQIARIDYISENDGQFFLGGADILIISQDKARLLEYRAKLLEVLRGCMRTFSFCNTDLGLPPIPSIIPGRR